jgi:hypothetical protein
MAKKKNMDSIVPKMILVSFLGPNSVQSMMHLNNANLRKMMVWSVLPNFRMMLKPGSASEKSSWAAMSLKKGSMTWCKENGFTL